MLDDLKKRVAASRYKAALSVNKELVLLYHHIGSQILESQANQGWGAKVIDQLSKDLRSEFPEMKGFSPQNLKYMRRFAGEYSINEIGQQGVDQIPWGHIVTLIYAISDKQERIFYIQKTIENSWSRNILSMQIEMNLFKRKGEAITNFQTKLPSPQSDLAQATLKNPYLFDFLSLGKNAHEREVEKGLVAHIEKFLLELGDGFTFVGRQYHLQVEKQDFYIDLLFYHLKLRSFVVIELKAGKFKPEYAGKINFYLSAVDDLLRQSGDNPSIGLILCRSKIGVLAEYTLRDMTKPIGLAEYKLTESLPENLKIALPSIEELEAELSKNLNGSKDTVFDKEILVRPASLSDITYMVALSYSKRRAYEKAQPQFWRYAEGAEELQSKWLSELLSRDDYILLVAATENKVLGFIIGQLVKAPEVYNPGGLTLMIDDFCVETAADWSSIGDALLTKLKQLAKEKSVTQLVLVTGHHDEPKREFLRDSGLACVSEWYLGEIDF